MLGLNQCKLCAELAENYHEVWENTKKLALWASG